MKPRRNTHITRFSGTRRRGREMNLNTFTEGYGLSCKSGCVLSVYNASTFFPIACNVSRWLRCYRRRLLFLLSKDKCFTHGMLTRFRVHTLLLTSDRGIDFSMFVSYTFSLWFVSHCSK